MSVIYTPTGKVMIDSSQKKSCNSKAYGYSSANTAWEGLHYLGGSGNMHLIGDREALINQSRAFMRNNAIYKGLIERTLDYVFGTGYQLDMRTNNQFLNNKIEGLWRDWVKQKPDVRKVVPASFSFKQVAREMLVAGDHAIIKLSCGDVQFCEAEQIVSPNLKTGINGLSFDNNGKLTGIWIAPYGKYGTIDKKKAKRFNVDDVIFITNPERPSQTRTPPPAQASFPMLHRINDMCDSEAIAAQLLSKIALSITGEGMADYSQQQSSEVGDVRIQEFDYSTIFYGAAGSEIKSVDRNIPGKDFEAGLRMFMRLLGLPLGLPLEVILLDWTKSNYSQSKAVLDQARNTFTTYQYILIEGMYRPLLKWKLAQWVAEGRIPDRKDYDKNYWIVPAFPWIDPLKEAQAHKLKIENGFGTYAEMLKSRSLDPEDTIEELKDETLAAIDIAKMIKKQTGVDVPWQRFAGLGSPSYTPQGDTNSSDEDDNEDENKNKGKKLNE